MLCRIRCSLSHRGASAIQWFQVSRRPPAHYRFLVEPGSKATVLIRPPRPLYAARYMVQAQSSYPDPRSVSIEASMMTIITLVCHFPPTYNLRGMPRLDLAPWIYVSSKVMPSSSQVNLQNAQYKPFQEASSRRSHVRAQKPKLIGLAKHM